MTDDVRIPLHELQADMDYLIGRVAADGSCAPMIAASIKTKLAALESALKSEGQGAGEKRTAGDPFGGDAVTSAGEKNDG